MRVCLLTNILPPYRVAFFNELARLCDLTVIFDAWLTPDRQWSVDESTVRFKFVVADGWRVSLPRAGVGYASERRYVEFSNRTIPLLRRVRPDIVVSAEMGARTLQASAYCRRNDVPLVCFWEGTSHTEQRASGFARRLRKVLANRCSAFWVNGTASAEYARTLGVPSSRIFGGMTGVDTTTFRAHSILERESRQAHRSKLGVKGTVFAFSGTLSARKGIRPYLAALDHLVRMHPETTFSLLFIGDGEQRKDVETWRDAHAAVPVVITGFVQAHALARLYVCSDWFVLPTLEDCWPLATLEPLVCGVPQIYSIYNGATADLSRWPQTGMTVDPLDPALFANALAAALRRTEVLTDSVIDEVATFYAPRAQAERARQSLDALLQPTGNDVQATALRINA